ncbi:MAG: isoprenylcysteine carboxylmethyltransferase family protein [Candidatus Bathyarchaeota archaeon]|jgi:protein-S-isoprenylcysteine O-methyltransferase Ste14
MNEKKPTLEKKQLLSYVSIFIIAPLLTFGIGSWLDRVFSLPRWPFFPLNLLGLAVILCGAVIGARSTRRLYYKGFGLPWGEASKRVRTTRLVTTGPYAHIRNPMTLGYSLLPCGMGLIFQSLGMAFFVPVLVLLINIVIIKLFEEPHLERRFGEEYRKYKEKTPFLIPKVGKLIRSLLNPSQEGDGS